MKNPPNTYVCPVVLEPVAGALDQFFVGALAQGDAVGGIEAHRLIRDDTLCAVYGKKGKELCNLVDQGLSILLLVAKQRGSLQNLPVGVLGLRPGSTRHIFASSLDDAFRTCALLYSSGNGWRE